MSLLSAIRRWRSNVTLKSRLTNASRKFESSTVRLEQTTWMNLDRSQSYSVTEVGHFGAEKKIVLAVIVRGNDGRQFWIRCNRFDGFVPEEFCHKGAIIPKLCAA